MSTVLIKGDKGVEVFVSRHGGGMGAVKVSEEDAHIMRRYTWAIDKGGYVTRPGIKYLGEPSNVYLQRQILGIVHVPGTLLQGDHIHKDKLDYRRSQIRAVTPAINGGANRQRAGVRWSVSKARWESKFKRTTDTFRTLEEAASAGRDKFGPKYGAPYRYNRFGVRGAVYDPTNGYKPWRIQKIETYRSTDPTKCVEWLNDLLITEYGEEYAVLVSAPEDA